MSNLLYLKFWCCLVFDRTIMKDRPFTYDIHKSFNSENIRTHFGNPVQNKKIQKR